MDEDNEKYIESDEIAAFEEISEIEENVALDHPRRNIERYFGEKTKLNKLLTFILAFNMFVVVLLSAIVVILGFDIDINSKYKSLEASENKVENINVAGLYNITKVSSEIDGINDFLNGKVQDILDRYIADLDTDYTKISGAFNYLEFSNSFEENAINSIASSYIINITCKKGGKILKEKYIYNIDSRNLNEITLDKIISSDKIDEFKQLCKTRYNSNLDHFLLVKNAIKLYDESIVEIGEIKYDDIEEYVTNNILTSDNLTNYYSIFKGEVDPTKPMLALTFDDGPYGPTTERILDTLKKYNSKATFFVLGTRIDSYPDTIRKAIEQGCQIGNHTKNHMNLVLQSEATITEEINYVVRRLSEIAGITPTILRPPYGNRNELVKNIAGCPLILWNVDTLDWKSRNAYSVREEVLKYASDGAIILMHDIYESTAAAVEMVVPELIARGYQLVTIDELYKYKGKEKVAGEIVYSIK